MSDPRYTDPDTVANGAPWWADAPEAEECGLCEGSGQIPHPDDPVSYECEQCGGTGFMPDDNWFGATRRWS